jgi:large subunit ribosomal protein L21e
MVVKSHGPRRRTREKFRRRGRVSVNRLIRKFSIGDRVVIDIISSSLSGIPFKRFQGLSGKVIEKRGRAYLVEIKDGDKTKKILATPEHLKAI